MSCYTRSFVVLLKCSSCLMRYHLSLSSRRSVTVSRGEKTRTDECRLHRNNGEDTILPQYYYCVCHCKTSSVLKMHLLCIIKHNSACNVTSTIWNSKKSFMTIPKPLSWLKRTLSKPALKTRPRDVLDSNKKICFASINMLYAQSLKTAAWYGTTIWPLHRAIDWRLSKNVLYALFCTCLLYTSPSPRD